MNPEDPHVGGQPERRASSPEPGPEARRALDRTLSRLTRLEDELRVLEGLRDHGAGFVAWLLLDDTAPEEPTLIPRYEQSYAGAWPSIDHLVAEHIDALGWKEELAELLARNAIPDDYLRWDHSAIYGRLHDLYDFVELDGLTHAFTR